MPANLTSENSFAYNENNGHPWHLLGKRVDGYMTIQQALELIGCGDEEIIAANHYVDTMEIFGAIEHGRPPLHAVPDSVAVYSTVYGPISTVAPSYEIMGRGEILQLAFDLIGLAPDDRKLDTIGNIGQRGEIFFAYVREDDLVVDPGGIADVIETGYVVCTSYNKRFKNTIGKSTIRPVCMNTLTAAVKYLTAGVTARHVRGAEDRMRQLAAAQNYAGVYDKVFVQNAEKMLSVKGPDAMWKLKQYFYPLTPDLPASTYTKRSQARFHLDLLYEGEDNTASKLVGENGYAAYNAFVEYQDFHRPVRGKGEKTKRAEAAVLPGVERDKKVAAANLILEGVQ